MTTARTRDAMADEASDQPRRRRVPVWLETLILLGVALVVSVLVKTYFVQMFFVPSASMEPLFVNDDRILVEKVTYWNGEVERGDVVVFSDPGEWLGSSVTVELNGVQELLSRVGLYPEGGHLVKRVIGIGGDRVKCCDKQGRITVNGVPLEEQDFILEGHPPSDDKFTVKVPEGRLWVMGDNRSNSEDSRFHRDLDQGTVPESAVVGKVWAVVWPFDRFQLLDRPGTFDNPGLLVSGD